MTSEAENKDLVPVILKKCVPHGNDVSSDRQPFHSLKRIAHEEECA